MNKQNGFTLIELLVVIAIIGVLASVVLSNLNSARERAKKASLVATISSLRNALEMYHIDNGHYPNTGAAGNMNSSSWLVPLLDEYINDSGVFKEFTIDGSSFYLYYSPRLTRNCNDVDLPLDGQTYEVRFTLSLGNIIDSYHRATSTTKRREYHCVTPF